jgi:hypothetical protein
MSAMGWGWITVAARHSYGVLIGYLIRGVKRGEWPRWEVAGVIAIFGVIFLFIFMQWASEYK